jgi:hypothetical protein
MAAKVSAGSPLRSRNFDAPEEFRKYQVAFPLGPILVKP